MIQVEVRLYATLGTYRPDAPIGQAAVCELADGTTVRKLLEETLGVPPDRVKTVFVNAISRRFDYILADGDRVGIFPPVAGG
jgi:sulfur-carrier protein